MQGGKRAIWLRYKHDQQQAANRDGEDCSTAGENSSDVIARMPQLYMAACLLPQRTIDVKHSSRHVGMVSIQMWTRPHSSGRRQTAPGSSLPPQEAAKGVGIASRSDPLLVSCRCKGEQRSGQTPYTFHECPAEKPKAPQPQEHPPALPCLRRRSTTRAQQQDSVLKPPSGISRHVCSAARSQPPIAHKSASN